MRDVRYSKCKISQREIFDFFFKESKELLMRQKDTIWKNLFLLWQMLRCMNFYLNSSEIFNVKKFLVKLKWQWSFSFPRNNVLFHIAFCVVHFLPIKCLKQEEKILRYFYLFKSEKKYFLNFYEEKIFKFVNKMKNVLKWKVQL